MAVAFDTYIIAKLDFRSVFCPVLPCLFGWHIKEGGRKKRYVKPVFPETTVQRRYFLVAGGWLKRKSIDSMAKGGWLIPFTPGSCNRPPARQRGPFKPCSASRKVRYISTASTTHNTAFEGSQPFIQWYLPVWSNTFPQTKKPQANAQGLTPYGMADIMRIEKALRQAVDPFANESV